MPNKIVEAQQAEENAKSCARDSIYLHNIRISLKKYLLFMFASPEIKSACRRSQKTREIFFYTYTFSAIIIPLTQFLNPVTT